MQATPKKAPPRKKAGQVYSNVDQFSAIEIQRYSRGYIIRSSRTRRLKPPEPAVPTSTEAPSSETSREVKPHRLEQPTSAVEAQIMLLKPLAPGAAATWRFGKYGGGSCFTRPWYMGDNVKRSPAPTPRCIYTSSTVRGNSRQSDLALHRLAAVSFGSMGEPIPPNSTQPTPPNQTPPHTTNLSPPVP